MPVNHRVKTRPVRHLVIPGDFTQRRQPKRKSAVLVKVGVNGLFDYGTKSCGNVGGTEPR